jgi:hypothetical protein
MKRGRSVKIIRLIFEWDTKILTSTVLVLVVENFEKVKISLNPLYCTNHMTLHGRGAVSNIQH